MPLTASPISMSRSRTASKTTLSDNSPRCRCAPIVVIGAAISAVDCRGGSQRNQFSEHVAPHAGLEISGRHQINPRPKEFFKFSRETAQLEQAH